MYVPSHAQGEGQAVESGTRRYKSWVREGKAINIANELLRRVDS